MSDRTKFMAEVRRYRTGLSKAIMKFQNAVMDGKYEEAESEAYQIYQMLDDMIELSREKPE